MITLLRKIRRSFIESNAVRKYLLYAIGEIALVVIGILIALQINNWNEWRKDQNRLQNHYRELIIELDTDRKNLETILEEVRKLNDRAFIISEYINSIQPTIDTNLLKEAILNSERYGFFSISNAAYTNLVSSGDIQFIASTQLKSLLSMYHNNTNWDWTAHNGNLKLGIERYGFYIHKFLPPLLLRDNYVIGFADYLRNMKYETYKATKQTEIDLQALRTDKEFAAIVSQLVSYRVFQLYFYKQLLNTIDEIKILIQTELEL